MGKWTKEELTCTEPGCDFVAKNPNGLRGHLQFKHNILPPSSGGRQRLEQRAKLVTEDALEQRISGLEQRLGFAKPDTLERLLSSDASVPITDSVKRISTQLAALQEQFGAADGLAHQEELERVKRGAMDGHNQLAATVNKNTAEVHKIIPLVQGALDRLQSEQANLKSELEHKISDLKAKLQPLTGLPSKLEGVKSNVASLAGRVEIDERRARQWPIDRLETLPMKDDSYHTFRVYKGQAGLIKPHKVGDGEYVDLSEPLIVK